MVSHQQRIAYLRREWLVTAGFAFLMLVILVVADMSRVAGDVLYDHLMRAQGFRPSGDIMIIALDDRSLEELGGWPLRREKYARLLSLLDDDCCRPKAIGFDLLFHESTADDALLAKKMKALNVVLPVEFRVQNDTRQSYRATPPVEPFASAASLAHINLSFDADGVIRGFRIYEDGWPQFSLAMQMRASETEVLKESGYRRFPIVDPQAGFPTVSLADALHDPHIRQLFKDKYIFVGATAPSLGDRHRTLYSGIYNAATPGVAILASILSASLDKTFIIEASKIAVLCAGLLALVLMLHGLLVLRPNVVLVFSVVLIALSIGISYLVLTRAHYWLDPTAAVLVIALVQPLWAWRRLAAVLGFMKSKTDDLKHFGPTAPHESRSLTAREAVLEDTALLDRAVSAAQHQLGFLSFILDEIPNAVMIFGDPDGLLVVNRKAREWFGENTLPTGMRRLDFGRVLKLPAKVFANLYGNPSDAAELSLVTLETLSGASDFYLKVMQVKSPDSENFQMIVLVDITELQQSQRQRDRALQFLSHDMRTPVVSIMSLTRQNASSQEDVRGKIMQHAKSLLAMTDDFILSTSAEAAEYKMRQELLDNLLQDARDQVTDLAVAKAIRLNEDSDLIPVFVLAEARLLMRVFMNVLYNAVKFSPPQSVIDIRIRVDNAQSRVTVIIANPVNAGEQPDPAMDELPLKGFGLGLDFVDKVVARHGGTIARRIPPAGRAEVSISLPCVL